LVLISILGVHPITWSVRPRWRASLFLLVILGPSLWLVLAKVRIAWAASLAQTDRAADLRSALALDPASPELHRRLGLVLMYMAAPPRASEGLSEMRRATELSPYRAQYWLNLATACESISDSSCADRAYEQAALLSPRTPRFQWTLANRDLRAGRDNAALAGFRRLLSLDPAYAPDTYRLCLDVLQNPDRIFDAVLPASRDPRLRLTYVNFLSQNGQTDLAHQYWARTVAEGFRFPAQLAVPYLDRLLELGRGEEAANVWQDLERLGVVPLTEGAERDGQGNLVYNGDFERTPLDLGLDWRMRAAPSLLVDLSDSKAYHGARCLRLDFTLSSNDETMPVYQFVPVSPNRSYHLTAYVRSDNVTSDSGPRLRVLDPLCPGPGCLSVLGETTVGTTPWHPVTLNFSTGPTTHLIHLSVVRLRSRTFPAEITGSFWLDSVRLDPFEPGARARPGDSESRR
jgi:tetratricopeptide (TPR) repeat protein